MRLTFELTPSKGDQLLSGKGYAKIDMGMDDKAGYAPTHAVWGSSWGRSLSAKSRLRVNEKPLRFPAF